MDHSSDPVEHFWCSHKDKNPSLGAGCLVKRQDAGCCEQLNEMWQTFTIDQYRQGTGKTAWPEGRSSPRKRLKASLVGCNAVIYIQLLVMQQQNSLRMLKEKKENKEVNTWTVSSLYATIMKCFMHKDMPFFSYNHRSACMNHVWLQDITVLQRAR